MVEKYEMRWQDVLNQFLYQENRECKVYINTYVIKAKHGRKNVLF
jgi:hypothetical protein